LIDGLLSVWDVAVFVLFCVFVRNHRLDAKASNYEEIECGTAYDCGRAKICWLE